MKKLPKYVTRALRAAQAALRDCSEDACSRADSAFFASEADDINRPWNRGGTGYRAAEAVRGALRRIEAAGREKA